MVNDPQTRKLARQLVGMDQRLRHLETVPQLAHSSVDDHGVPVYDKDGKLVSILGKQLDGTWGAPPLAGPVPPVPRGVSAVGGSGIIHVRWTGDFVSDATAPLDFDALEVLIDGVLAGAIPNRDGGSITLEAEQGHRYVAARIRSLVPRHSATTSPFSVLVGAPASELFDEAKARLEAAEEQLEEARAELEDAAANVVETRERLKTLEEETLPEAVAALEEADRVASERLTLALQQIQDAADVVVDASERLDEADRRLTSLNTRVDAVEDRARVYTSTPGPEAPVGSYWITATDHLYIRVPCEEVP